jgi:hypothetical protein
MIRLLIQCSGLMPLICIDLLHSLQPYRRRGRGMHGLNLLSWLLQYS